MIDDAPATVSLAISEMRRSLDVGLAKIDGQLGLLLQRADQTDRRADQQARTIEDLDTRLGIVERDSVTRTDLDRRATRTLQILGVLAAVLGIVTGAGTSIIITLIGGAK